MITPRLEPSLDRHLGRAHQRVPGRPRFLRRDQPPSPANSTRRGQTGGVRYITESELLEDVYTMNDFILGNEELGGNRPRTALRPQQEVTGLDRAGALHDHRIRRPHVPDQELRSGTAPGRARARAISRCSTPPMATRRSPGAIGWCAFDYNTHKDFGSGDRICHHGVMDMFREPKFAAYAYASQCEPDEGVVLEPVTFWARGERNIGGVLPLIVLTNCDEVELRYGDACRPSASAPDRDALPAPAASAGHHRPPPFHRGRTGLVGHALGRRPRSPALSTASRWPRCAFRRRSGGDHAGGGRRRDATSAPDDCVRVMVRALDQAGNKLPFLFEPVDDRRRRAGRAVGPALVPLRGGVDRLLAEATGATGTITVDRDAGRVWARRASPSRRHEES